MASSLAGLGTSLDINTLVSSLMQAEQLPLTALTRSTQKYQSQLSALGTLKSGLSSVQGAAKALAEAGSAPAATASAGDSSLLLAAASSGAAPGNFSVEITRLAQSAKLYSAPYASAATAVGGGTLNIELGSYAADNSFTANPDRTAISLSIDPAKSSLADIRDAVNAKAAGVTAAIINDGSGQRLVFTSTDTGAANAMRITATDADGSDSDAGGLSALAYDAGKPAGSGANLTVARAAQDAAFSIDGLPMTRPGNTISDVVDKVTFTLQKTGSTSVSVTRDGQSTRTAVDNFIKAYNSSMSSMKSLTAYDQATRTGAALFGDSTVRSAQAQLRGLVNGVHGSGNYNTLSRIGIGISASGSLSLTASKFEAAMKADPAAVASLLSTAGSAMADAMTATLAEGGSISSRTTGVQSSIKRLSDQQLRLESRLSDVETRYRTQFTSLEKTMSSMNNTLSYLKSQFSSSSSSG
jgi:flagellar hook-associated protein 2